MHLSIILTFLLVPLSLFAKQHILFIPGAASSGDQISLRGLSPVFGPINEGEYFKFLNQSFKALGYSTLVCPKNLDDDSRSISERANDCKSYMYKFKLLNPRAKFHIVGHSMGGIVARKIISSSLISFHVKSITTISTPHRGSELASFALKNYKEKNYIGRFLRLIDFVPASKRYLKDISLKNNYIEKLKNPLKIPIYSISNFKTNRYNVPFNISEKYISSQSDGLIETSSMSYGHHLGVIEADHFESACILYTKKSKGCQDLLKLLSNHLEVITK